MKGIFETFVHEAFERNATDFMTLLLSNLPKHYLEETFIHSENYISYVTKWLSLKRIKFKIIIIILFILNDYYNSTMKVGAL